MMTLNHGFSGYICARVAAPVLKRHCPFSEKNLVLALFLGAMLPDLDILSTVLGHGAYFSGAWYGHRQFSHSVPGTLMLALLFSIPLFPVLAGRGHPRPRRAWLWLVGALWAGGWVHIFGDLFTPGMKMPVFWPLDFHLGGFSHIGWFSPYLLWLFVATIAIGWGLRLIPNWHPPAKRWIGWAAWGWYGVAAYRWVNFLLTSRYDSFSQWAGYQQDLLPEVLIAPVTEGVRVLWFWLTR